MPPFRFVLIDGYNLLLQTYNKRRLTGPGNLERARNELLGRIAHGLSDEDQQKTTIVFDSDVTMVPDKNQSSRHHLIKVEFASDYPTADLMIADMLQQSSAPRQTLVVSSDHQVQLAAKRRGAEFIDSLDWLNTIEHQSAREGKAKSSDQPPNVVEERHRQLDEEERRYWLAEFGFSADEEV